jgi:SAM-dependent methyltransferase
VARELIVDAIGFWEQRHVALGPWRSGGDRGLSGEENYEFYAYRLGRIIELIRRHAGAERGHRILDAGCGRGHLTNALARCGHLANGIDTSATAIAWAHENYGRFFEVSTLDEYRPPHLYDVVLCIDVLFHVLDDARWCESLLGLGRCAAAESVLILTEVLPATRYQTSDYIVHRSRDEYDAALRPLDFTLIELVPYEFGANPNQFAVYRRRP